MAFTKEALDEILKGYKGQEAIMGPEGLIKQLTKALIERAMETELSEELKRLKLLSDGRLLYRLKKQWRDGTSHIIFQPHELMERLVALVPAPRFNMIRYSGVFAPASG